MALVEHAERELKRAGLFDADADYGGMLGQAVLELIKVFASQGHSGGSAHGTLAIFNRVASFKTLSPLTSEPSDWVDVSEVSGEPMWQSRRQPSVFSRDGGATWYDIDAPRTTLKDEGARPESALERFERISDEFYRETGYMRPGKDDARGTHSDEERWEKFEQWLLATQRKTEPQR